MMMIIIIIIIRIVATYAAPVYTTSHCKRGQTSEESREGLAASLQEFQYLSQQASNHEQETEQRGPVNTHHRIYNILQLLSYMEMFL